MANHNKSNGVWTIDPIPSGEVLNTSGKYMDANIKINKFTPVVYSMSGDTLIIPNGCGSVSNNTLVL